MGKGWGERKGNNRNMGVIIEPKNTLWKREVIKKDVILWKKGEGQSKRIIVEFMNSFFWGKNSFYLKMFFTASKNA